MRNLISNLITNVFFAAENNNNFTSDNEFAKFTTCSEKFDTRTIKGGNGEEEGGSGIIIEDDVIN